MKKLVSGIAILAVVVTMVMVFNLKADKNAVDLDENSEEAKQQDAILIKAILTNNLTTAENALDAGADPNSALGSRNETALIYAITRAKSETLVNKLLEKGADPNQGGYLTKSPLDYAILLGNEVMVHSLIKYKANVNTASKNGQTPLLLAVNEGHNKIVKMLIEAGANINHKNEIGHTALLISSYKNFHDLSMYLKQNGAKEESIKQVVDASVVKQISRELASLNGSYAMCAECNNQLNRCSDCQQFTGFTQNLDLKFLKSRADQTVGESNLMGIIARQGNDILGNPYVVSPGKNGVHVSEQTFKLLHRYQTNASIPLREELSHEQTNPANKQKLIEAQKKFSLVQKELVDLSIKYETAKDQGNQKQINSLTKQVRELEEKYQLMAMTSAKLAQNVGQHDSHSADRNELIMALLQHDLTRVIGENKCTPVKSVVNQRHSLYLMKLLQIPLEINALDNRILVSAVTAQNTLSLRLLLEAGANPNLPDSNGEFPIHKSVGYPSQMHLLLKHGADPDLKNKYDRTALMIAERMNDEYSKKLLVQAQKTITPQKKLMELIVKPDHEIDLNAFKQIINKGAKISSELFFLAVKHNRIQAVEFMLSQGIKVKDIQVEYPLLRSTVKHGHVEMAQLLLDKGAKVDEPNHLEVKTPLMLAAMSNHLELAQLLLASGANKELRDEHGFTLLDLAARSQNPEMSDLFIDKKVRSEALKAKEKSNKQKNTVLMPTEPNAISGGEIYIKAIDVVKNKVEPFQKISPWDLIDHVNTELIKADGKEIWQVTFSQSTPEGVRLDPLIIKFSAQGKLISVSK